MNYIKITLQERDLDRRDTLMALLSALDITGFEETEDSIIAYAQEDSFQEENIADIAEATGVTYQTELVAARNWNEEWERNFEPVLIDGFCSVRADFHPKPEKVMFDIVITPKMSFGTGHHATTASMMTLMRGMDFQNKSVFDFGTGTGILAILAEMMGAASILAIDNDEWSYNNALENCERNAAQRVVVQQATADDLDEHLTFDIILANINRHILLEYMEKMSSLIKDNGILLLSGILIEDIAIIRASAAENGLVHQEELIDGNWVCIRFSKG